MAGHEKVEFPHARRGFLVNSSNRALKGRTGLERLVDHAELDPDLPSPAARRRWFGLGSARVGCDVAGNAGLRPRYRWVARLCAHACGVLLVVAIVAAAGLGTLFYRLAQGPLSIAGLNERIASELGAKLGHGYKVELGASAFERVGGALRLTMAGLAVRAENGRAVFNAPRASVSVALPQLLIGVVKPTRVELFDVELGLTITADGSLAVSAGADPIVLSPTAVAGDAAPTDAGAQPRRAANDVLAPLARSVSDVLAFLTNDSSPVSKMEWVGIRGGRLTFDDRVGGRVVNFNNVELGFERQGASADLSLAAVGPSGHWEAHARAGQFEGSDHALEVELRDMTFDEVALVAGLRSPDFFFDMPLSAKINVGLDGAGALVGAVARFNVGSGFFFVRDEDFEPIFLDAVTGGFRWDGASKLLRVEPTQWVSGETHLIVTGNASPPVASDDPWRVALQAEPGSTLGPELLGDTSLAVDNAMLALNIFPDQHKASLERFGIESAGLNASMSGEIDWGETTRGLKLNVQSGRSPVRSILRIWPSFIAPPVHSWLLGHLNGGTVEQGALTLDFDGPALDNAMRKMPPADDRLHIDFSIADARLLFLAGVPPLTSVDATAHVTGHTVTVAVKRGLIEGGQGRKLTLSDGAFHVADTTLKPSPAVVTARLAGTVDSLVDILARDGLRPFVGPLGDTSAMKGQVDGRLSVDLMLDKKPRPDDTRVQANVNVSDLSIDRLIGKEKFDQGQLAVVVDQAGMRASGQGRLFGGPGQLDFRKPPVGPMEANIAFTIDDASRARIAPAFATGVSGPIQARVSSTIVGKDAQPARVELDFTKTVIDNALPGLVKPQGRPAKASFRVTPAVDGAHLDQLDFESTTGASIKGSIDFDPAGAMRSARLSQLRLSPGDDMKVDVDQGKDALKLVVRGASIDARPFLRGIFGSDAARDDSSRDTLGKDLDVDLKSTLVTGANKQSLTAVDMKLSRRAGAVRNFQIQGRSGRASVTATTAPDNNGNATISIKTLDGGGVLSFVDLYRRMEGGNLRATIQMSDKGVSGGLFVSDFILRDEPALRKLVSEGVPNPNDPQARKIDTTAAPFQRLSANFTRANGALVISDGVLYGTQIGIKIDGKLDTARDRVDMAGTFVPAYGLNNLFDQIPLFGPILSGGAHEGLFAVNFRVSGPASAPSLVINPLSAIAPGFLHKIFGVGSAYPPSAGQAPGFGDVPPSSIPR